MIALIDRGLYDRTDVQFRSVPEERAMRYSAVCTSMLTDRVEDLEYQREDAAKRVTNLEVVMDCQGHSHPKLSAPLRGSNRPLLASTELAW